MLQVQNTIVYQATIISGNFLIVLPPSNIIYKSFKRGVVGERMPEKV